MGLFDLNFESGDYSNTNLSDDYSLSTDYSDNSNFDWGFDFFAGGDSQAEGDVYTDSYDWGLNFESGDYSMNPNESTIGTSGFFDNTLDWLNTGIGVYEKYQQVQNNNNWLNGQQTFPALEQQANAQARTGDISKLPTPAQLIKNNNSQTMPSGITMILLAGIALLAITSIK